MSEFQFAWPWLFLLLPLPLLMWRMRPIEAGQPQALKVPYFDLLKAGFPRQQNGRRWLLLLAIPAWLLLIAAAARPQWVGEAQSFPVSGRDLLMAVDISGSMDTRDMILQQARVNRLDVVKQVAGEFLTRRTGDRVGLILFGSRAYLQTPLTFDTESTATLLTEADIGLAGRETAIGDAIGLALKRLREDSSADRVLILLTDGANTAGEVEPLQAAEFAAREGLTIYTIGVGAEVMQVRDIFGTRNVNPSADLDEEALQQIAQLTSGEYFRARDTQELSEIYARIEELEPVESDQEIIRPVSEWFYWPLAAAFLLAVLTALARQGNPLQVLPRRSR